ncbi:MAG: hypothetical protein OEU09_14285 [Rhodospirillales bacterium]|nr:hypothetical protein [Rhodospirillales bacterium]MDH3912457.1 hypothetical protein [Rhodospirillales bacterium]MDH3920040.1 hypothetical protein [Rhodospirillales bacterium]MDH3966928.1 hypothetical protein [Rhodospirillales bacterium]
MIALLATIALALGGLLAAINWGCMYASYKSGGHVSPIPLLGALFLVLGLLGFERTRAFAWLGIVADYGTIVFIAALPTMLWEAWTICSINLVHRFVSEAGGRRDDIRLFKRDKCTIRTDYDPPKPYDEHGTLALSESRFGTWRRDSDEFVLEGYCEDRVLKIRKRAGEFRSEELNYPGDQMYQTGRLDRLTLKRIT